jgi:hypothetical protein
VTTEGLPTSHVSVDQVLEGGCAVHNQENDNEYLQLGPLPPEIGEEELRVEIWDRNEGRVVDPRYRPEVEPPNRSIPPSKVVGHLSMNDPDLGLGDYVVGVVREAQSGGTPQLVTGGYRIEIPGVQPNELVIAKIEEAKTRTFGANSAKATRIDYPSVFRASVEADLGLKRLMATGRWGKPRIGELESSILSETVERVEDGHSHSILNPGYDPDFPLRVTIEHLYHTEPGRHVALLTSGTSVHWGQKGELRDAYRGYGLAVNEGEDETAVPIDQIFAHSYVHDGEMRTSSESLLKSRLVLTKSIDELSAIDGLAVIVVDYTSRKSGTDEETIEEIRHQFPDTPIVSIASPFTKNEGEGVPRYGPPTFFESEDTVPRTSDIKRLAEKFDPQVGRTNVGVNDEPFNSGPVGSPTPPSTTDLLGFLREPQIEVKSVESGEVSHWFEIATGNFKDLLDNGVDKAGYKVYSVQMFFERLPVTPQQYNEWIRQRYDEGERYLPETTDGILEDLESYGGQIQDLQAPASIFGAVKAFREIENQLRSGNPMFERLYQEVSDAAEENYRVGIFCPRKSWIHMLGDALRERGFEDDVIGANVVLLNCDTIRDTPPCRRLLFTGPQRPQYAGFYLHPRVKETVVFTYDGRWSSTVQKHTNRYVGQLNLATSGATGAPYRSLDLETDDLTTESVVADDDLVGTIQADLPQKGESGSSEDVKGNELDSEDLRRLKQLVELSPTKNGELADKWGYDSGSEVYQYLSSNLGEFYTRNEDKLIVPTEEGISLVKKLSGRG